MDSQNSAAAHESALDRFLAEIPTPRFDRAAVRDLAIFDNWPRPRDTYAPDPNALPPRLAGIPVYMDEAVAPGVVELRKGDEVVERVVL